MASMCYRGLAGRIPYWGLGGLCRGEGANEMTKEGGCDGGSKRFRGWRRARGREARGRGGAEEIGWRVDE